MTAKKKTAKKEGYGGARKNAGRKPNPVKDLASLGEDEATTFLRDINHLKQLKRIFKTCYDPRLQVQIIMRMREWARGKPTETIKLGNVPGEKFAVSDSARDKLLAKLLS